MHDHAEIQKLLAPYCGGDLNATDLARVEEHLASCTACRADLADLQTAVRIIRTTPEVEPPPWLTPRIMSRLREEKREKRSWLQRLFVPLQIKLPLEALAVLMVCVTGYYLSRSDNPEMKRAVPQLSAPALPQAVQQPAEDLVPERPAAPRPEPAAPRSEQQKAAKQAAPASSAVPTAPPAFVPAPPAVKEGRSAPAVGAGVDSKRSVPYTELSGTNRDSLLKMKKATSSGEAQRSDSGVPTQVERSVAGGAPASAAYPQVTVRVSLADAASANGSIRKAIKLSGGGVVEFEPVPGDRKLKARIPAGRFRDLIDSLGRLGRIAVRPPAPDSTGIIEVVIEW